MKLQENSRQMRRGLSLVEVLLVIATLVLVAAVFLPMIAREHSRPSRISCTSNIKMIGLAYRLWSNDHDDQFPFASTNIAGSLAFTNSPQVFRHFIVMSNELVTPKILRCFSDDGRTTTGDFQKLSNGNLSYFVGFEAHESNPQRILIGDRNITGGRLTNGFLRLISKDDSAGWTTALHSNAGNLGLADGSASQVTPASLNRQIQAQPFSAIRLAIP